jgi:hypothetical protein
MICNKCGEDMTVTFFKAVFPLQSRETWVSTDGPTAEKDIARVWSSVIGKHLVAAYEADLKSCGDIPFSGIYWSKVHSLKLSAKMHYRTGNNIVVTNVLSRSQSSLNSQSTWIRANIVPSCTQFSISLDHVRTGPVEWFSDLAAICYANF